MRQSATGASPKPMYRETVSQQSEIKGRSRERKSYGRAVGELWVRCGLGLLGIVCDRPENKMSQRGGQETYCRGTSRGLRAGLTLLTLQRP